MLRTPTGRTVCRLVVLVGALLAASCGGDDFHKVYPVKGKILVDGKPAADCMITLNRTVDDNSGKNVTPTGMTDEKGEFQITTYVTGDGAPEGEYVATIEWRERSGLLKNNYEGPDRFDGAYTNKDQNKSKKGLVVTIGKGPQDLPLIELVQSPAAKRKVEEYKKQNKQGPILGGDR